MNKILLLLFGMLFSILSFGQIPTINLSSEFRFNDGSLLNTAGSGINFTQSGNAMLTMPNRAGGADRAVALQGDYLHRANDATNSISVSYWVQTTTNDANKRVIIDQTERTSDTESSNKTGWYTYLENGKIGVAGNFQWYHSNNTSAGATGYMGYQHLLSSATINDGIWHHVGITMRARWYNWFNAPYGRTDRVVECQYILYVDGVQDGVLTQRQNLGNAPSPAMRRFTNSSNMRITVGNNGAGNSTVPYQNGFDDFRFYRLILSAAQMGQLAAETACGGSTSATAIAQNITIQLDVNGNAIISASDVNNGSENSCGEAANISISKTLFTCADVGANNVTLTADDGEGHTATAFAIVTVEPLITVITQSNLSVELDASGNGTLVPADLDNGSTSSCTSPLTFSVDRTSFTCADIGSQAVILTATDGNGNTASAAPVIVVIRDIIPPIVITQDISVVLGANGRVSIIPADIDNGTTDNCGSLTFSLSQTVFTCDDIGDNQVTFTAIASGNGSAAQLTSTGTAIVTVTSSIVDQSVTTASSTFCPDGSPTASTTVTTGSSETGINYYLRNSTDNTVVDGPITGTGRGLTFNTGVLSETTQFNVFAVPEPVATVGTSLDFDGVNDKVQTTYKLPATNTLTIEAMFYPKATTFARIISSYRGSNGLAPGEFDIDNSPSGGAAGRGLRFLIADANGTAVIYGVPNVLTLNTWNHIAVTFDSGVIKLFVNGIQVGTTNASFSSIPANNSGVAFGEDRIQGFAEYYNGKMDEVRFWNTVRTPAEIIANKDKCLAGNEAGLDAYFNFEDGTGTTLTESVSGNNGTLLNMDNTDWVDGTTLTCGSGCGLQMATEVTIGDDVAPTAVAQNITTQLDATGNATITSTLVNDGSNDNCTDTNSLVLSLDITAFTCANLGANSVILTVEDAAGNQSTATATVTVVDGIAPTAIAQNITVQLDANGDAVITAAAVNNGSTDNCTTVNNLTLSLDKTAFTCANLGVNPVILTVEDFSGIQNTATATVTVVDGIVPTAIAQNITVQLDANGSVSVAATDVNDGSSDNCTAAGSLVLSLSQSTFDCADIGANPVILTVTDASTNFATATATVTVEDNLDPTAITRNITVNLDATGNASITAAAVNNGSTDNCTSEGDLVLSLDVTSFTIANLGANTVILTVADANGNSSTATATITVEEKTNQTITFSGLDDKTYGNGGFTISATASSNLAVSFSVVSGPATITGNDVSITGAGAVLIEANQAGNATFAAAPAIQQSFTVAQAALAITADDQAIIYGEAIPTLSYSYAGFVNDENSTVLTDVPAIATTATATSDAGSYPITLTGGTADNYALTLTDGSLIINKADQTVNLVAIANQDIISVTTVEVTSTSSAGLATTLTVTGPATISGTTITLDGSVGTVTVTATQAGNVNYNAATDATTSFEAFDSTNPCLGFVVTLNSITDNDCNGAADGVINIGVTGGDGNYTYAWSNGTESETAINLVAGSYTVTVTDGNNCTVTLTESISEPTEIQVSATTTDVVVGNDGAADITVTGGTGAYTYSWSNGADTEDLTNVASGTYTITVTDANGCLVSQAVEVGDIITAIEAVTPTTMQIYPNPVSDYITLEGAFTEGKVEVQVINSNGQLMLLKRFDKLNANKVELQLSSLKNGQYLVIINTNNQQTIERIHIKH